MLVKGPGAAIFVITNPQGKRYLHTGDFRFDTHNPQSNHPALQAGQFEKVYLDTTYCDPRHTLYDQAKCVNFIADTVAAAMAEDAESGGVRMRSLDGRIQLHPTISPSLFLVPRSPTTFLYLHC